MGYVWIGGLLWFVLAVIVVAVGWSRLKRPKCPACGLSVDRDLDECPYCGASLS